MFEGSKSVLGGGDSVLRQRRPSTSLLFSVHQFSSGSHLLLRSGGAKGATLSSAHRRGIGLTGVEYAKV